MIECRQLIFFSPCRKRKPRKNTTKYGPNAKVPTKRAKKQDNEPENPIVQPENATVEADNATVQAENATVQALNETAIVPFVAEDSIVVTSPTKPNNEAILQDSPIRLTRR